MVLVEGPSSPNWTSYYPPPTLVPSKSTVSTRAEVFVEEKRPEPEESQE